MLVARGQVGMSDVSSVRNGIGIGNGNGSGVDELASKLGREKAVTRRDDRGDNKATTRPQFHGKGETTTHLPGE